MVSTIFVEGQKAFEVTKGLTENLVYYTIRKKSYLNPTLGMWAPHTECIAIFLYLLRISKFKT